MPSSTVVILLASYNGAAFLPAQLDSIAAQSHRDWRLIVSDDGSSDATRQIVGDFAARYGAGQVTVIDGPRQGATRNFLHLVEQAPRGPALAFCDQDDVWYPEKLARAMAAITPHDGPAHYAARTIICAEDLTELTPSRRFSRPFGFRNALIQACMAGNTAVFNSAAAAILQHGVGAAIAAGIESHDWWAYQLISGAGGLPIHDPEPVLSYRQHGRSEMGRNDTPRAMAKRLGQLFQGDYGTWLQANHRALDQSRHLLTAANRDLLDRMQDALHKPGPLAAAMLGRLGLYRHTPAGTAAFYAAAFAGRLRP